MTGPRLLTHAETVDQLTGLPAWREVHRRLRATFDAPDVPTAVRCVVEAFDAAEEMGHHPDVDIRHTRVAFSLTSHHVSGISQLDVELAHRIDRIVEAVGAVVAPRPPSVTELAIDTSDVASISPFWQAALGYRQEVHGADDALVDPAGNGPDLWFQLTDSPAEGRNRLHVDVTVGDLDEARSRCEALENAGGRLMTDAYAPAFWVYADPDGNEVCVCTGFGREGAS